MSFKTWATTKEITGRWNQTGLLETAADKTALAMLLEGQRIYNEKKGAYPSFNRVSIPLAVRVANGLKETALLGSTVEMPNWYTFKDVKLALSQNHNLDEEAEQYAKCAEKLAEALDGLAKSRGKDYIAVHCFSINPDNTIKINYSVD